MFDHDRSAARGKMCARKLVAFKHASPLGNAQAHKLLDLVKIERKGDPARPPRAFGDYEVRVDKKDLPKNVELLEIF
jgi:CRISPR-associated protein Csd2